MDDVSMPLPQSEEQAISIALHHLTIAVGYYEASGPKIHMVISKMNEDHPKSCFVESILAWSEVLNRHFSACPYDDEKPESPHVH